MVIYFKTATYRRISIHPLSEFAYTFDCTFFRLIDLTAKALRRMTMNGFLVGATKPKKHTLKRVQLRILGSKNNSNLGYLVMNIICILFITNVDVISKGKL